MSTLSHPTLFLPVNEIKLVVVDRLEVICSELTDQQLDLSVNIILLNKDRLKQMWFYLGVNVEGQY